MLVPEIRFEGFSSAWEQRKLGDMGTMFTGLSGKTKDDFGHGEARFVTYMNVFTNPVSDSDRVEAVEIDKSQNAVQHGDIFFMTSSEAQIFARRKGRCSTDRYASVRALDG